MVGIRSVDNKPIEGRKGDAAKSGPAKTQPPFGHPGKMMEKPGKRASGSDKSKGPRKGGDAARKAQEWGGGSKGSKGDSE